jgi:hypothetical protein
MLGEDGESRWGEDRFFCALARALDFHIYTHWRYHCDHLRTVSLADVANSTDDLKKWLELESAKRDKV